MNRIEHNYNRMISQKVCTSLVAMCISAFEKPTMSGALLSPILKLAAHSASVAPKWELQESVDTAATSRVCFLWADNS